MFIFDLKTKKYYREIGDSVIAEDREECSFIWDNYFDEQKNINQYELAIFVRARDGRYDKFEEEHYQRAYSIREINEAAEAAGMDVIHEYNAFTRECAREDNDRIYFVLKNRG